MPNSPNSSTTRSELQDLHRKSSHSRRGTQRDRILALFQSRPGQWIGLPEILALGFAQFGARILELRRGGFRIENKTEYRDWKILSWYRLAPLSPAASTAGAARTKVTQIEPSVSLFGDLAKESYGVD